MSLAAQRTDFRVVLSGFELEFWHLYLSGPGQGTKRISEMWIITEYLSLVCYEV